MKEFVEKLIERLEEYKYTHLTERDSEQCQHCIEIDCEVGMDCTFCVIDKAIEIIKQLAEEYVPEINVGKWIPCSERLPESKGNYLVCSKDVIWVANYFHNTWWGIEKRCRWGDVEAWQPLPEAYKPEPQKEIPTDHFTERFNRVM